MKIVAVTPKLNDRKGREISIEGNNSQANPGTETHNETIKEKLFGIPMGGSTRKSKTTNTNNKSRSTKIPAPKIGTQQKRDSMMAKTAKSKGEEFSNRSTAFTSQNVKERRYKKCASGITKPRKLKDYFIIKDKDSEEKLDNDIFFEKEK